MAEYADRAAYRAALAARAALPQGFRVATTRLEFFPVEKQLAKPLPMNLSLILADEPTPNFAATYTRNRFCGWPVVIGRDRLAGPRLRGILVNNKISNVNTAGGREDAERLLARLAALTGARPEELVPSSTGIIGWKLPVADMEAALPRLAEGLHRDSYLPAAEAIMTTDAFPKLRSAEVALAGGGTGRVVGIAKGAGMIEPNMATMLVFILTDVEAPRDDLRRMLSTAVDGTFNRISVDSDQSTSDTVLLLSSGKVGKARAGALEAAVAEVCARLAEDVVRNGEGTQHVIRVTVRGRLSHEHALAAAKGVVNSPLVKTAVCGNDPNVGRVLMALGDYFGNANVAVEPEELSFAIGGVEVYTRGRFVLDPDTEAKLSRYMRECRYTSGAEGFPAHERCVEIDIAAGRGTGAVTVTGADLSCEYVKENADYRS
jgi:glutamate N-acetyltransferase / amino-acid N-acetyltransferase